MRWRTWDLIFYLKLYEEMNVILCWWESSTFSCVVRNRWCLGGRRWVHAQERQYSFSEWRQKTTCAAGSLDKSTDLERGYIATKRRPSQRQDTKARWKGQQAVQFLKVAAATQDAYYWTNALRKCWLCFCAFQYRRKGNGQYLNTRPSKAEKIEQRSTQNQF